MTEPNLPTPETESKPRFRFDWQRLIPKFWLQNDPTDWLWDSKLNELLDQHEPVPTGSYTVKVGSVEVWVSNYPYSYGCPWELDLHVLPSVKTRKRLRAKLQAQHRRDFVAILEQMK